MNNDVTVAYKVHFGRKAKGRLELKAGEPPPEPKLPEGRVPRISKLMALAIRVDELVRDGEIADYAEAARLAQVTRARMTQIMNLINLAPAIQEALLFMPKTVRGRDIVGERVLRAMCAQSSWREQK